MKQILLFRTLRNVQREYGDVRMQRVNVLDRFDIARSYVDQYQYLGNCPPTPPLMQQQSTDKLGLMLG